jgi:5-methylcytosine-specific restriction endonuclease McrA
MGRGKTYKDGIRSKCKECLSEYSKKWRSENIDVVRVKDRERGKLPDRKEKHKKYTDKYYANNKDFINGKIKQWRLDNLVIYREKAKIISCNRRARVKGNGGTIKEKEWKKLCDFYGNRCLCCGAENVKLTIDHVIPIKLGGTNTIDNAQPLCGRCNSSKGARHKDYRILIYG